MFNCAWCNKKIGENQALFGLNVKFVEGSELSSKEGEITHVYLTSRGTKVPMIVTTADSEAKKEGVDGVFPICSEPCSEKLKKALEKEKDLFKEVSDLGD
ncbi:hypothetical protein JNUCC1_01449 [Lentibacillus sp. JNUCC-1]|uniref:hypothetical protein n=1 Tax=Lentibacillus sp. JNUCC-1 TaxID=2654513 RepID=UPI0012E72A4B|nr:hypothetical protein [Lentibacillus sp. JNUCC-1]MUV37643.1 hypothetical protein [Lentibacillus sp. JNUCC-1]